MVNPTSARGGDTNAELRVLVVTAMYPTAHGTQSGTFIKSQVESLAEVGVRATVLHLQGRSPLKYLRGCWRVFRLAHPARFDLVHGHYGYCGIVARAQLRLPVVVSFCGDDLLGTPDGQGRPTLPSRLVVLSSLLLAQVADGVIVKSEQMRRALRPRPRAPLAVIPNGVDLGLFRPGPRAEARRRLGLEPDPARRYLLFPADPAIPRKAFAVAQAALDLLQAEGIAAELLVAVNRPQSELVDCFNAADVVLLPSLWEGSPNVVKEALACNVPVVAADVGDVRPMLEAVPGCAVVERTPEAFAAAIRAALALPPGASPGRAYIEAHLSLPAVARRVRALFDRALARRQGARRAAEVAG